MPWYIELEPVQEPFDLGPDDQGRAQVAFNVGAVKAQSATFLRELLKLLTTASVGTLGVNIFASSAAEIPEEGGPYLHVRTTGGTAQLRTQNAVAVPAYQRPSAQLVAKAPRWSDAETMAYAAYNALRVRNQTVTPL